MNFREFSWQSSRPDYKVTLNQKLMYIYYLTGLLRFTLHLLACRLHYTFESEVKYARNDTNL